MDEETAKAAQEISRATGKGIDAAQKLGGFFSKILGNALGELGESLHDWAKLFRYKNLLRIQDRVEEIHSKRKLEGKFIPIPPRSAIPLLESASREDEPALQELWAALIANATDPNIRLDPRKVLIDVLSHLEPLDVKILQFLAGKNWLVFRNVQNGGYTVERLSTDLQVPTEETVQSLQNLARLGLVGDEYETKFDELDTSSFGLRVTKQETTFRPSPMGHALLKACTTD